MPRNEAQTRYEVLDPALASRSKDIFGRVYEYFLGQFANGEGKKGRQLYSPARVARLLVEMLAPYKGRIYDPCCGSVGIVTLLSRLLRRRLSERELLNGTRTCYRTNAFA